MTDKARLSEMLAEVLSNLKSDEISSALKCIDTITVKMHCQTKTIETSVFHFRDIMRKRLRHFENESFQCGGAIDLVDSLSNYIEDLPLSVEYWFVDNDERGSFFCVVNFSEGAPAGLFWKL